MVVLKAPGIICKLLSQVFPAANFAGIHGADQRHFRCLVFFAFLSESSYSTGTLILSSRFLALTPVFSYFFCPPVLKISVISNTAIWHGVVTLYHKFNCAFDQNLDRLTCNVCTHIFLQKVSTFCSSWLYFVLQFLCSLAVPQCLQPCCLILP